MRKLAKTLLKLFATFYYGGFECGHFAVGHRPVIVLSDEFPAGFSAGHCRLGMIQPMEQARGGSGGVLLRDQIQLARENLAKNRHFHGHDGQSHGQEFGDGEAPTFLAGEAEADPTAGEKAVFLGVGDTPGEGDGAGLRTQSTPGKPALEFFAVRAIADDQQAGVGSAAPDRLPEGGDVIDPFGLVDASEQDGVAAKAGVDSLAK